MARKERVTRVIDGDTFETASRKNPVRLANVNAPEKGRHRAHEATDALRQLIENQEVLIDTIARDRYGPFRGESEGRQKICEPGYESQVQVDSIRGMSRWKAVLSDEYRAALLGSLQGAS